jgi:hypothetical protein
MKNINTLVAALILTGILGLSVSSVMADESVDESNDIAYEEISEFDD